jgi:hypothetical protein
VLNKRKLPKIVEEPLGSSNFTDLSTDSEGHVKGYAELQVAIGEKKCHKDMKQKSND